MAAALILRILGPVEVSGSAGLAVLGGAKQRLVLVMLALADGRVVPSDRLVDAVWGDGAAESARRTLQVYVSTLRNALAKAGVEGDTIIRDGSGYRLTLPVETFDHFRFSRLLAEGQRLLGEGKPAAASDSLRDALALWRGPALGDLADQIALSGEAQRFEELRLVCIEERVETDLALGHHAELVGELDQLIAQHPLRERVRGQVMLALYRSGRQAEALDAYQATRALLVEELGIEPGAPIQELHRRILQQDPGLDLPHADSTAASAEMSGRSKLPVPASSFLGREAELYTVSRHLTDGATKLLTLTGPGGTGKTRLALKAAADTSDAFPDGVTWVPLAPVGDQSQVLAVIARTLGLPDQANHAEQLVSTLSGRSALLVLDNAEHVLDGVREAAVLLAAVEGPTLMLTSRERLRVSAERVFPVPPLEAAEGSLLFVERAEEAGASVERNGSVTAICAHLDNLPLAIELAAARAALFSPTQLLERLQEGSAFLKGPRDADPRQRTIREAIDWSYQLLDAEEQHVLRALSVYPGGCTYEAAEKVAGADPDLLESLLDKSLSKRRHDKDGDRYWMLTTIREYAAERLEEAGEAMTVVTAATQHLSSIMAALAERVEYEESGDWLGEFEAEEANLSHLVGEAIAHGATIEALELAAAAATVLRDAGRLRDGNSLLERTLAAAPDAAPGLRAKALSGRVIMSHGLGDYSASFAFAGEARVLAAEAGDHQLELRSLGNIGAMALEHADAETAARYLTEAIALAERLGDEVEVARGNYNLSSVMLLKEEYAKALPRLEKALELVRVQGNKVGEILTLTKIGYALYQLGEPLQACRRQAESLQLATESGRAYFAPDSLGELAVIASDCGDRDHAQIFFATLDAIRHEHGSSLNAHDTKEIEAARRSIGITQLEAGAEAPSLERCCEAAWEMVESILLASGGEPAGPVTA